MKKYSKSKKKIKNPNIQNWLLNFAIFCLAIVFIGFMFSMRNRISQNRGNVDPLSSKGLGDFSSPNEALMQEKPYLDTVVEVLNGCGVTGLAQQFTNFLRKEGFDVIYTGNADRMNYQNTYLIEHAETPGKREEILNILMFDQSRVVKDDNLSLYVDYTLIVGKDYSTLSVYPNVLSAKENF